MRRRLKQLLRFYRRSFILNLKATIAYPTTFWFTALTIPLWVTLNILFIETVYGQTQNFLGYTKYENYVLFGTFKLIQSIAVFLYYVELTRLKDKINGIAGASFDTLLLKPIDSQLLATTGRYNFGSISSLMAGMGMIAYGLSHEYHFLGIGNIITYLLAVILGVILLYLIYLFIQTWLFWFEYLQIGESLWFSLHGLGHNPKGLYKGALGVILNLVIPITLMGAVPIDFLFGRISLVSVLKYVGVIMTLIVLTRKFWQYSIRKYSSFSS